MSSNMKERKKNKNDGFKLKAISFNLNNYDQSKLYEYVMRKCGDNFSGHIKELIRKEMMAEKKTTATEINHSSFINVLPKSSTTPRC